MRGSFITFDGIDGVGKSTQIKLVSIKLKELKRQFVVVREPGTTQISEQIREILLSPKSKILPETEMLLYLTSRVQLLGEVIRPAFKKGYIIISDRYLASTICYQGVGLGLGYQKIHKIWSLLDRDPEPDLNIILHLDPTKALKRTPRSDRISMRKIAYFDDVSTCFKKLCDKYRTKYKLINADNTKVNIFNAIWAHISKVI